MIYELLYLSVVKEHINSSQLAKMKKSHVIYRDEAVGLKKMQLYLKNYDFCEYVDLGQFRENLIFCQ